MKLNGIAGQGSGKLGSHVWKVVAGSQVLSQYQPVVANPSTPSQVNQRAKMKLMSQIAASLAPVIVIPKNGLKSSRNQFIAKNFPLSMSEGGVAQITIENLQLTNGNSGLPGILATRSQSNGIEVSLDARADGAISRVCYILYSKTSESTLQYVQSVVCETPGDGGTFPAALVYYEGDIVLFAYGMKDLSANAKAKYANMSANTGVDIAQLVSTRRISASDFQFTQTRGVTMFAGDSEVVPVEDGKVRVFVTALGPGSVSGAGQFDIGSNVTVVATPTGTAQFVGWRNNGSDTIISTSPSYTFVAPAETLDLIAVFRDPTASYTITVDQPSSGMGSITGGGTVEQGQSVTLTWVPQGNWTFSNWSKYENGQWVSISSANPYTFTPTGNMRIQAELTGED